MAISTLQQQAFLAVPGFSEQVNGMVRRQAQYDSEPERLPPSDPAAAALIPLYRPVIQSPGSYGFPSAMVADAAWGLTYDAWASDPDAAEGAITTSIDKLWYRLTLIPDYVPTPPAPPE